MKHIVMSTDTSHFDSVYAGAANSLRNNLAFQFYRVARVEPECWESRLYDNGLVVIAPVAASADLQSKFDEVNLGEAFCKAISRTTEAFHHVDQDSELLPLLASISASAIELAEAN